MKRKFISVLLALVLAISLSLVTALPAAAEPDTLNVYPLQLTTKNADSTAQWSTNQTHTGSYSAHLDSGNTTAGDGDEARIEIAIPAGTTLNDLTSISWWVYAVSGYPPHLDITLDCDGDTVVDPEDMLTAEMNLNCVGAPKSIATLTSEISYNTGWLQTFELTSGDGFGAITDSTIFWVTKMGSGDLNAPSGTLGQWKAGIVAKDPESEMTTPVITGNASVVKLEIEVDNWVVNSEAYVDDVTINGVIWYGSIQDAIDCAEPGDTISVAAGTYEEDLSIPEGKDNLELVGASGATIKGVETEPDASFPLAVPNIDILSPGVKIHGFTIEGPDAVSGEYASGMLIGAANVEIYDNDFKVTAGRDTWAGAISTGIVTYRKVATGMESVDISGLNIHGNTFTNHGTGAAGFDAIFINLDTGTGTITIAGNDFTGNVARAISVERSNVVISGNDIITDLAIYSGSAGGYQGMYIGCFPVGDDPGPVQTDISITGNTVKGSTSSDGFAQGIRVGHTTQEGLENITVSQNTVQYNDEGITVRADASGVTVSYNDIMDNNVGVQNDDTGVELDAEDNWWGSASGPTHADNTFNVYYQGDVSSDDVDYCPWLDAAYDTGTSFAPVTSEDGIFSSIQAAIDAATSTTITCAAGSYSENLYIDKSLTVQSEEGAITEEEEWEPLTELYGDVGIQLGWDGEDPLAETVVFDGFYMEEQSVAIYIEEVNNGSSLTISNNVLYDCYEAIYCGPTTTDNGSSVTIEGNYIFYSGRGIDFYEVVGGSEVTIRDNEVFWNEDVGIYIDYLAEASTVTIEDNLVAGNYYGIEFYDVDGSTVTIAGNTIGEGYSECVNEMLYGNYYYGIYFSGEDTVSNSTITIGGDTRAEGNVIVGNGDDGSGGICVEYMEASSLEILNNDILDNYYYGVDIYGFDEDSSVDIHYNSIVGNGCGVNYDSLYLIDATCNWWGDVAGPYHWSNPYSGRTEGDSISSDVAYIPWLIQSDLADGWNIWSAPIAPDEDSWAQMQVDLVAAGLEAIYYFDSATQLWGADASEAGPLDAFYIKMSGESRIRYYFDDEATFPGQKAMKVGWNLVGLAQLYDMYVYDALYDAYYGTGQTGLVGYSKVISPVLNGDSWMYLRDDDGGYLYPTEGYWVFMVNDGMLGGFTSTPIVEDESGP